MHVIDVYFGEPGEWEGFADFKDEVAEVELCAQFSVARPSRF
jgi:hypothetical protein